MRLGLDKLLMESKSWRQQRIGAEYLQVIAKIKYS